MLHQFGMHISTYSENIMIGFYFVLNFIYENLTTCILRSTQRISNKKIIKISIEKNDEEENI